MAIAFVTTASPTHSTGTTVSLPRAGAVGNLIVAVLAFQGVAAGSGPWVDSNPGQYTTDYIGPSSGWARIGIQAPSATGVGIEVWAAISGTTIGTSHAALLTSRTWQTVQAYYSGVYAPNGNINDGAVRASAFQQWTGNTPQAPTVNATQNDMVLPVAGMLMVSPGFGTPTGSANEGTFTTRSDAAGGGFGTVETVISDAPCLTSGATGAITWPGNAASSGTPGATATLVIRPAPPKPTSAGLVLDFTYPTF